MGRERAPGAIDARANRVNQLERALTDYRSGYRIGYTPGLRPTRRLSARRWEQGSRKDRRGPWIPVNRDAADIRSRSRVAELACGGDGPGQIWTGDLPVISRTLQPG